MRGSVLRLRSVPGIVLAAAIVGGACGVDGNSGSEVEIVASIPPLASMVRELAGEDVAIEVLLPRGGSPHFSEASPKSLRALERADLVLAVGHPGLAWEARILEAAGDRKSVPTVTLGRTGGGTVEEGDPHLWLSLDALARFADELHGHLADLLPDREDRIRARRDRLAEELESLGEELRDAARGGHPVVVTHSAWGRLAGELGVEIVVVEREGKEPSARALAETIDRAREIGAVAVVVQPGAPHRAARVVSRDLGIPMVTVDPLDPDWRGTIRRFVEATRP